MAVEGRNAMRNKVQKTIEEAGNIFVSTWGMLFRTLFIIAVGYFGYSWIDPQALGDKPLSQLTLNNIVSNLMAGGIVLGCIVWFFHFPTSDEHNSEPYLIWAQFGAVIVGGGILVESVR
jgi:magnesium-transporting ATPase (P-type)